MLLDQQSLTPILGGITLNRGYADAGPVRLAEESFKQAGLRTIGTGSYGLAVEDPDHRDRVLKVSMSVDDPWRDWIKLCATAVTSMPEFMWPFCPVVYGIMEVGSVLVAQMERLHSHDGYEEGRDQFSEEVIDWLTDHVPRGSRIDFHSSNWMERYNGDPVITDPWAHSPGALIGALRAEGGYTPSDPDNLEDMT